MTSASTLVPFVPSGLGSDPSPGFDAEAGGGAGPGPEHRAGRGARVGSGAAPTVLRCSGTADFLAALPALTGFTAENSLFAVLFSGRRANRAIRFDLPDPGDTGAVERLLDGVSGLLRTTGAGREGPAFVITSTRSFSEAGGPPWRELARRLRRRMRQEGWALRDLAVIAPDGWAGLMGRGDSGRRRPLSEISASPIAAVTTAAGVEEAAPLSELGRLPDPDPRRAAAILAQLAELDRRGSARTAEEVPARSAGAADTSSASSATGATGATGANSAPPWAYGVVRVARGCFENSGPPDPRLAARLIRASERGDHWLLLLLATMSRAESLIEIIESVGRDRFVDVPVDIDAGSEPGPELGWSLRRLLHALASMRPDLADLKRAVDVLSDAAAHAPVARRPGLLALLAWAWWMRGMGSVAARVIDEAAEIDADHELLRMMRRLTAGPPAWAVTPGLREPS